jgi:hypothetical protein
MYYIEDRLISLICAQGGYFRYDAAMQPFNPDECRAVCPHLAAMGSFGQSQPIFCLI